MDDFLGVGIQCGFCSECLDVDVGHAGGGALGGQVAYCCWVQAVVVGEGGDLDAAAGGQIGDIAIIAYVAHEAEGFACCDGFYDI